MREFKLMWISLLRHIEKHCSALDSILNNPHADFRIDTLEDLGEFKSLVGVDKHPYKNSEQGVSIPRVPRVDVFAP